MSHSLSTQARCVCERGRCVCASAHSVSTCVLTLCKVTISDYYETLLVNGIGHKRRTHQRHERSVKAAVSGFSPCTLTCNFTDCEAHNGLDRAQNSNLSPLTSETMWYQPIFIELLTVLLLLQEHMHFPSPTSRHFPLTTYLKSSCIHSHFTTRNGHEILRKC